LRWDQIDLASRLIRLGNDVKTPGSVEPVPLSDFACEVLQAWKGELASNSPYVFPSPVHPDRPISTVKTAWRATLKRAGVPHFPLYTLRHVFCTRLSGVAPDAVIQRAMRHASPETKRRYQLGMADQVRQAMEKANESAYGPQRRTTFLLRSAANQEEGKNEHP
jgi:integrase